MLIRQYDAIQWKNYYFDITSAHNLMTFHVIGPPWYLAAIFYCFIIWKRVLVVVMDTLPTFTEQVTTINTVVGISEQVFRLCCSQPATIDVGESMVLLSARVGIAPKAVRTRNKKSLDYRNWRTLHTGGFPLESHLVIRRLSALTVFHQVSDKDFHHSKATVVFLP